MLSARRKPANNHSEKMIFTLVVTFRLTSLPIMVLWNTCMSSVPDRDYVHVWTWSHIRHCFCATWHVNHSPECLKPLLCYFDIYHIVVASGNGMHCCCCYCCLYMHVFLYTLRVLCMVREHPRLFWKLNLRKRMNVYFWLHWNLEGKKEGWYILPWKTYFLCANESRQLAKGMQTTSCIFDPRQR